MVPLYCRHCGKPTGQMVSIEEGKFDHLDDHCEACIYTNVTPVVDNVITLPVCRELGILCGRRYAKS